MRQAYKFRLFPNRNQLRELGVMLETHRRLYNACLAQRKESWEQHKKSIGYCQQSAWFKSQRGINEWFAKTNFSSAQGTMRRLDKAFANFFRRVKSGQKPGYPRFRAADRYDSVEFPAYGDGIRLTDNRLQVQHVGTVRCKAHRPVEGTVKTATLKREAGKWFVVLSCDLGNVAVEPNNLPPVGIDVGIEHFYTTSDGTHESNPKFLKKEIPRLRRLSRSVSRKRKGGQNRRKAVRRLQRLHARIACCRHDHRHKTSLKLVRRYGIIAVESLNIRGMLRNHRLARAISDAGWAGFLGTLGHKAERAGGLRVEVNCRGTSQECSGCPAEVRKSLSERVHRCHSCGLVLQRDVNAARNILARALQARTGPVGANCQRAVSQEAVCFS